MATETLWKVRVGLPGGLIHLVSSSKPSVRMREGRVAEVNMTLVTGPPDGGDEIGFIDWPQVLAVTWRECDSEHRRRQ